MSSCLVQQLFRQKIGLGVDPYLIDDILFPLLFSKRDYPKELLVDINLTRSCNDHGHSSIVQISRGPTADADRIRNCSPFTKKNIGIGFGKYSSKRRRMSSVRRSWGSIDILNELRDLKQPQIGYHNMEDQEVLPNTDFDNYFIRLEEEPKKRVRSAVTRKQRQGRRRIEVERQNVILKFINDYLEDALNTGKRLSWGGDPYVNSGPFSGKILSTSY